MYLCLENQSKLFLDKLFELNNDGAHFSDLDIRDEAVTMLIGVNISVILCKFYYHNMLYFHIMYTMFCIICINGFTGQ